ncbi:hypothetical protein LSPH26S_00859 [Lysinibacillus sphaericus]
MVYPYFFVLLAAILWGMTGTAQTFLDKGVSPIAVATIRSAIGGGLLLVVAVLIRKISFRTWCLEMDNISGRKYCLIPRSFFYFHPFNRCSDWNRCDNWECSYVFRRTRVVILENTPL